MQCTCAHYSGEYEVKMHIEAISGRLELTVEGKIVAEVIGSEWFRGAVIHVA